MKFILCLVVSAVAWAQMPLTPMPSIVMPTSNATFGMVGIAAGQTARVNVLGLTTGGPIVAGGCQTTVTFLDESGKTLATKTLALTQGQAVHFDLASAAATGLGPAEIRATVSASSSSATISPVNFSFCSIFPTMEIFDQATGRTAVYLDNPRTMPTVLPLAVETAR